ncbi:hypothetical protein [Stigmatella aurantiaca]|nr:hypothetical protein [Stigmatella aurantiaca]ADO69006.1 conserved uncharacterized protein [Stigmatella aurantiaca DW4/3-1]
MPFLLRILALLLVLTTGGVFQTLALASEGTVACADEEESGQPCADCALCLCCPLRAAPSAPRVEVRVLIPASLPPPAPQALNTPVSSGVLADIFRPPRA